MVTAWFLAQSAGSAATFSITPAAVSNTYVGTITVQAGGLTNGEPVVMENYYDVNANGFIDASDLLLQSFRLTDGQWSMIGGVPNINVPGDMTGPDGAITSLLGMVVPEPQLLMGNHLIRLSSPYGNFTPLTNTFVITNWPFPQSISGTVTCDSTNVPYAVVVALSVGAGSGGGNFAGGIAADGAGHYALRLAPGTYQLLSVQPGFVFNAGTAAVVSLGAGDSATDDLELVPATQLLAGQIVDATNTSQGLPGVFMVYQSASGLITVGSSDANGFFQAGVVPDIWEANPDSSALAPLGYLEMQNRPWFDTSTGSVSTAFITVPKGTAMFYGSIKNETNGPIAGVSFYANDGAGSYESTGWSALDGSYCVLTLPGGWGIDVDNQNPSLAGSVVAGSTNSPFAANQAVRADFVVAHATASISGTVRDASGSPVGGVDVYAYTGMTGGTPYHANGQTDGNGHFSLGAVSGTWNVGLSCDGDGGLRNQGYNCVFEQAVNIPPTNAVANFTVYLLGTPLLQAPVRMGPSTFGFWLEGASGFSYQVQATTNPSVPGGWTTILTTNLTVDSIFVQDNQATNRQRFYRALRN